MELTIEISCAALLPALIDAFTRGGCRVQRYAETSCRVVHSAHDEAEARLEVAFFLRAWQLCHPGVDARIS
jgi:hypothetical protein